MRVIFINRYFYPDQSATSQLLSELAFALAESKKKAFGANPKLDQRPEPDKRASPLEFPTEINDDMQLPAFKPVCVALTSRQLYEDAQAPLTAMGQIRGVQIIRLPTAGYGRKRLLGRALDYLSFYRQVRKWLRNNLQANDVVVVKTDPPLLGLMVHKIVRRKQALLVQWLQDVFPEIAGQAFAWLPNFIVKRLAKRRDLVCRQAAANVVISPAMHEYFRQRNIPENKLRIINNWSPVNNVEVNAERNVEVDETRVVARRAELGVTNQLVVGHAGNLGFAHDDRAIEELITSCSDNANIHFLLSGGGRGYDRLQERAKTLDWQHVTFLPYQSLAELPITLAAADLQIVSQREGMQPLMFPSKFYGVLSVGCPVLGLCPPSSDLTHLIHDHKLGLAYASDQMDLASEQLASLAAARLDASAQASRPAQADQTDQSAQVKQSLSQLTLWKQQAVTYHAQHGFAQSLAAWSDLLGQLDNNGDHSLRERKLPSTHAFSVR